MLNLTKDNFKNEVLESKGTVVVDFWAPWCGPCRSLGPIIENFDQENPEVKVGKVNIDDEQEIAGEYRVMSIPTVLIFKDGKVVNKSVGLVPKEELENLIK